MQATRLSDRARGKLVHLLSDDRPRAGHWLARLKSLGEVENVPAFSSALRFLFHVALEDGEAEREIRRLLAHRRELAEALGRDPGLRVAGLDYFSNVAKRYANPKVVELEDFEETERSARIDAVTGLYNRRVFTEALERETRRSRRYKLPMTVLMLDVDDFKGVNDAYGHMLGDLVLERLGGILRHSVREADLACRYGGEEFAVILPETDRIGGYVVADRIRLRVEHAFSEKPVAGHDVPTTVSCGLAMYPDDGLHAAELVLRADQALYNAKRAGRNRTCVHHDEKRAAVRFPVRAGARVHVAGGAGRAIDLSRVGALVETEVAPRIRDSVALAFDRTGRRAGAAPCEVAARVVRVSAGPSPAGRWLVGLAFDAPLSDDHLLPRVTLTRPSARPSRGGPR